MFNIYHFLFEKQNVHISTTSHKKNKELEEKWLSEIKRTKSRKWSVKFQAINHRYRGKCHWAVIIMTNFGANFRS